MFFTDQLHRKIHILDAPQRIVSLVPSQTELLVDLGLEDNIVGITKFCVHPRHLLKTKTIVGGTKKVHFDKIKNLYPDIIICNKEENTRGMVLELEKIAPVWVTEIKNVADCLEMILAFGELFQKENQSVRLCKVIRDNLIDFQKFILDKPLKKTAYLIWKNPYMAAGNNTFINHLLEINHFENIFSNKESYPELTVEDLKTAECILLSSEPYPFKEKDMEELQTRFPEKKILLVDGEYFSWYGSRLQHAFDYFKRLHSDL